MVPALLRRATAADAGGTETSPVALGLPEGWRVVHHERGGKSAGQLYKTYYSPDGRLFRTLGAAKAMAAQDASAGVAVRAPEEQAPKREEQAPKRARESSNATAGIWDQSWRRQGSSRLIWSQLGHQGGRVA